MPSSPGLTHLLVRHRARAYRPLPTLFADPATCVMRLAEASPSLCWIGIAVEGDGLRAWSALRDRKQAADTSDSPVCVDKDGQHPTPNGAVTLVELDQATSRRVVMECGLNEFRKTE